MKVHVGSKFTKDNIYCAYAFIDDKGRTAKSECLCIPKTSTRYVGYLTAVRKALRVIEKGAITADKFDFLCESQDIMNWFEHGELRTVPKKYRSLFSDILKLCVGCEAEVTFTLVKGVNYAKRYATEEYYNEQENEQIQGVSALDLFADM